MAEELSEGAPGTRAAQRRKATTRAERTSASGRARALAARERTDESALWEEEGTGEWRVMRTGELASETACRDDEDGLGASTRRLQASSEERLT